MGKAGLLVQFGHTDFEVIINSFMCIKPLKHIFLCVMELMNITHFTMSAVLKTAPGRHAQFSVKKTDRSGQVISGKEKKKKRAWGCFSLPGCRAQFIYLEAVNAQFRTSSKKHCVAASAPRARTVSGLPSTKRVYFEPLVMKLNKNIWCCSVCGGMKQQEVRVGVVRVKKWLHRRTNIKLQLDIPLCPPWLE